LSEESWIITGYNVNHSHAFIFRKPTFYAFLIFLVSAGLRLYRLGAVSLDFDEVGVAIAAAAPTVQDTLTIARSHAMAMPLDYLVTRLMAQVSLEEGWLRLPAALWGILSVWVFYRLSRKLAGEWTAVLATAFLSLATFQIRYSQELRFYAAGLFFYLLALLLLWRALAERKTWLWAAYCLAAIIGCYFHPFVVMVVSCAAAWVCAISSDRKQPLPWIPFLVTTLMIAGCFVPGYLYFGSEGHYTYGPTIQEAVNGMVHGLGWLPDPQFPNGFSWLGNELFFPLSIIGTVLVFRRKHSAWRWLLANFGVQIAVILAGDFTSGYFIAPRQFIFFLPFTLLLAAVAINALFTRSAPLLKAFSKGITSTQSRSINQSLAVVVTLTIIASNAVSFSQYNHWVKSDALEASKVLASQWKPGNLIWAVPDFSPLLYRYYLEKNLGIFTLSASFEGREWNTIPSVRDSSDTIFLLTQSNLAPTAQDDIRNLGFSYFWGLPEPNGATFIWIHSPSQ
jgi:4-amino-4-deoxy-L-arabinose transferase-like glycosyltransferase